MSSQLDILKACSKGWSQCKAELQSQYKAGPNRRDNLRKLAQELDLPASVGDQMEDCLNGNNEQCAKAAATIAAVAACDVATAGACPVCCSTIAGPVIAAIWPIIGPTMTGIAEGATSLISVGLEWIGVKDSPDFSADVYWPMRSAAQAQWQGMRDAWLAKYPGGEAILTEELNRTWNELQAVGFMTSTWYPTAYGNISLPANMAPFGAKWDLSWDKAWERDDAFAAGANALGIEYGVRLNAASLAIARATGRILGARSSFLSRVRLLEEKQPVSRAIAAGAATVAACGIVGGTWYFLLRPR